MEEAKWLRIIEELKRVFENKKWVTRIEFIIAIMIIFAPLVVLIVLFILVIIINLIIRPKFKVLAVLAVPCWTSALLLLRKRWRPQR
jgi:uncharacterized membrane protein